jgi:hypothetical protein
MVFWLERDSKSPKFHLLCLIASAAWIRFERTINPMIPIVNGVRKVTCVVTSRLDQPRFKLIFDSPKATRGAPRADFATGRFEVNGRSSGIGLA